MNRVRIIAEVGINHNGEMGNVKKLIDVAVFAGCDAVKFQKRTVEKIYTKEQLDSPRESPWGTTTREQKQALEFGKDDYDEIDAYCKRVDMPWFASAWDTESQMFLRQYDLPYNKIASAMLTYEPLLEMVAKEKKLTYISTGMSTIEDVHAAVEIFREWECPFVLMHCVATYPTVDADINLKAIETLQNEFGCGVGYSNHSPGILMPSLAVVMGAVAIECHVTIDRTAYGSDQAASIEPMGLWKLCKYVRAIEVAMGNGEKIITEKEKPIAKKLRWFEQ